MARLLRMAELQDASARLLDIARERFGEEIDLDAMDEPVGLYWAVDPWTAHTARDLRGESVGLGDVSDDIEEALAVVNDPEHEVFLWHDLDHLAGVLTLLAYLNHPRRPDRPV
jgi:hypothetical protein